MDLRDGGGPELYRHQKFWELTNIAGVRPLAPMVQAADYGTAQGEGSVGGTIFKIQPDGSGFTVLKQS